MKKRFLSTVCAAAMALTFVQALPETVFSGISTAVTAEAASVSVNSTDVKLYYLSPQLEDYITKGSEYPDQFQLKVTGASKVTYSLGSGSASVKVSDTGLITVAPTVTYWYGSGFYIGYSTPREGEEPDHITYRITEGTRNITVNADGTAYNVTVNLTEYSELWYQQQLKNYVDTHISSSMTDLEKLNAIAAYPASFNYDYRYQGGKDMLMYGGGDCWASTNLIVDLCEAAGIKAWGRNANKDAGAGSGHRNAVAELNGQLYILEAGYGGSAPRSYNVYKKSSPYSYKTVDGGIEIYQYDGDPDITELEVPSAIDGKKVVSVGESCFYRSSIRDTVKSITLPDTVTNIGFAAFQVCKALESVTLPEGLTSVEDSVFYYCTALTSVNIPNSVTSLGANIFSNCTALTKVDIKADSPNFICKDHAIYTKDMTKLVTALHGFTELTVPSGVKVIGKDAFRGNYEVLTINLPYTVEEIEEGAFYDCNKLKEINIKGNNLKKVGDYAFARSFQIEKVRLGRNVTEIGDYITAGWSTSEKTKTVILCYENTNAYNYAVENDIPYELIVNEVKKGDLNHNDKIDAADLLLVKSHIKGVKLLTGDDFNLADVDDNGKINASDLLKMKAHIKGVSLLW